MNALNIKRTLALLVFSLPGFGIHSIAAHQIGKLSISPPLFTTIYSLETFFGENKLSLILFLLLMVIMLVWLNKIIKENANRLKLIKNYSSLVENMPILYAREELIYDANGNIVDFIYQEINPTFEKYFLPKSKILGKKLSELGTTYMTELLAHYHELKYKRDVTFQYFVPHLGAHLTVVVMHSNTEGCVDVFCVDNTELSVTQQALRSTNHKLASALEVADIIPWKWELNTGNFICDVRRELFIMQDEATASGNQVIIPATAFFDKIYADDKSRMEDACSKLVTGGVSKIKLECRMVPNKQYPENTEWLEVRAMVDEKDESGKPLSIVGSSVIITQRKVIEKALIQAKLKAEETTKLQSAFLANMSHEIRTPLNAIIGFSGILASVNEVPQEEKREYMQIIESNNSLLLQLVSDILDLSKIESGTMKFVYNPVDLHELFVTLEDLARMRNANPKIEIKYNQQGPEHRILMDKERLNQVIGNLIANAIKFTKRGSVEFGYHLQEDNLLYFYVKDTGCGIPEESMNTIFDRFVKVDSFVQGTGLGLSICRTTVQSLGGEIGVNSKEGEGSTFWFTLPYTPCV